MPESTIVIPFALAPAEHAKDLLTALRAPYLARSLPRARPISEAVSAPFAALLPHEQWLSHGQRDTSPPLAHAIMQQMGMALEPGWWFLLQPAHFHVALDHLVLTDHRQLSIGDDSSQALFDAASPLFGELGYTLRYGDARHWFLRADAWCALRTCTPDAACGHNIDVWLPRGDGERDWRRLHNEVQMLWHTHSVNEERDRRGERRINALWLWGGSENSEAARAAPPGLSALVRHHLDLPTRSDDTSCSLADTLIGPALAGDWSAWLAGMADIDARIIAPALDRLAVGEIDRLNLVLTDSQRITVWQLRRASLRQFWVRASLSRLAP